MASSNAASRQPRHPLLTCALAVLLFIFIDEAAFRTGWYQAKVSVFSSSPSTLLTMSRWEQSHVTPGMREIAIIGNSQLDEAFYPPAFTQQNPNFPYHIVRLTAPGTWPRSWYYLLKSLDPTRRRFKEILVSSDGYKVIQDYRPLPDDFQEAVNILPLVPISDWLEFIESYPGWQNRLKIATILLFPSHAYAADIQDVILHPKIRLSEYGDAYDKYHFQPWKFEINDSVNVSLAGFAMDPKTCKVLAMPLDDPSIEGGLLAATTNFYNHDQREENERRNADFDVFWYTKILQMYQGSPTKIIFLQVPNMPAPFCNMAPLPDAPDIRDELPKMPNLSFLDPVMFAKLNQPQYFRDEIHLNLQGQSLFTAELGDYLIKSLSGGQS